MLHTLENDVIRLAYLVRLRDRENHGEEKLRSINYAIAAIQQRIAATIAAQMDVDNLDEIKMVFDDLL